MAKAKKELELPSELYVTHVELGNGEVFLAAEDNAQAHADLNERKRVGHYVLQEVLEVEGMVSVRSLPKKTLPTVADQIAANDRATAKRWKKAAKKARKNP